MAIPPHAEYHPLMGALTREQFIDQVLRYVAEKFPLVKIARGEQEFSVVINGHLAPLENLYRTALLRPGHELQHIERWVVELLRVAEGTPDRNGSFDDLKDRILPMIVAESTNKADVSASLPPPPPAGKSGKPRRSSKPRKPRKSAGPPEPHPAGGGETHRSNVTEPFVEGLNIAYAIDSDRTIAYLPLTQFKAWDVSMEQLHETAMENLVKRSETMAAHAAQDESGRINLIVFQTMDGYDASRILLPNLHDRLREHLGSPFAAAIPNRDILLCFRDDPEVTERLREQVAEDYRTKPHGVTDQLLLVTRDGIAPLRGNDE